MPQQIPPAPAPLPIRPQDQICAKDLTARESQGRFLEINLVDIAAEFELDARLARPRQQGLQQVGTMDDDVGRLADEIRV